MVNSSSANVNAGTYTFVFDIPQASSLNINLVYMQTAANPRTITELVQITVYNPLLPPQTPAADPSPLIVGDPQFVGLRGQSYQIHGIDGAVYNIVTEPHTQVNSRFVFLTAGSCPVINNKKDTDCWTHPGSYLGDISFQAIVDGKLHTALVQAGPASKGFTAITFDGQQLSIGEKAQYGAFIVEVVDAYNVVIDTQSFRFYLANSDMFINQGIRSKVLLSQLTSHGLLGQTHNSKTYPTALKWIVGRVDDYLIADDDIFGTDFVFNRFNSTL